jgi:hypothetical protein
MKKQEFILLIQSGAIASADLVKRGPHWTIWIGIGQSKEESATDTIHGRSGEMRTWADMARAYEFVRACGWRGTVEVDEVDEEIKGPDPIEYPTPLVLRVVLENQDNGVTRHYPQKLIQAPLI